MKKQKHKCALCGNKIATWQMTNSPKKIRVRYFCDECLPKKMISGYSFNYSKDGYDLNNSKKYFIEYEDCLECLDKHSSFLSLDDEFLLQDKFGELFVELKDKKNHNLVEYNLIMSKYGDYLNLRASNLFNLELVNNYKKFYEGFKNEIKSKRFTIN